jgi:phage terminase small subunit
MSALYELTQKQQRFVEEYLIDLNATQAAIRAGYSKNSASEQAYDLLRKPQIEAAVAEQRAKQSERCRVKADDVIAELVKIGFANLADYYSATEDGTPYLDMTTIPRERWAAIKRIKTKRYAESKAEDALTIIETEIELKDSVKPLLELGKHLGLFRGDGNSSKSKS